jgi:hypothetical protein
MTVTVWFVRDGPQMQRGSSAYQLPLATCVARLGFKKEQWVSGLDRTPRFGDQSKRHSELEPYRHVVCAIDEAEAKASGWRAGYYRIELDPKEVIARLGPPRPPVPERT